MKKIIVALILGVCIGFIIGVFTGFKIERKDRRIASNDEFNANEMALANMELYNEALKNSKPATIAMQDSKLKKELLDQMEWAKTQPPIKFDEKLCADFIELLNKQSSNK
jgi:hypothetical protein